MNDKIQYWLDLAQYDLDTAQAMLETKRYLYVGFMCHQVIEKTLKAIISSKDIIPPKIHRLSKLAQVGECYNLLSDEQKDFLDTLDPLNITARYPENKDKLSAILNDKVCKRIYSETGEMLCYLKSML